MTHILVVEDEDRISALLAKGLTAQGYAVSVARTAHDGLDQARSRHVDLVVLDLGLPDEDGMWLLKRLREAGLSMPVIILTARSSVTDTVAGLESGADDYMAKPVRFEELLARVRLRLNRPGSVALTDSALVAGDLPGPEDPTRPGRRPRRRPVRTGVRPGRDPDAQPRPGAEP